jgi:hypothetical protein
MTKPVTMIFKADMTTLEKAIIQDLNQLQGVTIDSNRGEPKFEKKKWRRNFPKSSWMATNAAEMDMETIRIWWMPPKPPPQKVSDGGKNIKPVQSEIGIDIGCLKTNRQASVVCLVREWTYNARNHIPYTEIPLLRSDSTDLGSYSSDRKWLRHLLPEAEFSAEYSEVIYSSKIMEILKRSVK